MKTRMGFVSNSSTTSYCIYGAGFVKGQDVMEYLEESGLDVQPSRDDDTHYGTSNFEFVAGIKATRLPKDKTIDQIRVELLAKFKKLGHPVDDKDITWQEGAWRDG